LNYGRGINLYASRSCILENNICSSNAQSGIFLEHCFYDTITIDNNTCEYNEMGIVLEDSVDCSLGSNTMTGNGIFIDTDKLHFMSHTIEMTNLVNEKPVYYFKNQTGIVIPSGAGQVILVNCSGLRVEEQNCSNCTIGIYVGFSSMIYR